MRKPSLGKEKIAGIITIVMTAAFFIALLWGYGQYQQSRRAMALLENEYQRAYYNYLTDVKEMTLCVGKAHSAGALQRAVYLTRISTLANAAANHMSILPLQHPRYQRSVTYLNQVGDYAASLSEKLARGEALAEEERGGLAAVYAQLQDIYAQMAEMETMVADSSIIFAAAASDSSWWQVIRSALGSRTAQGGAAAVAELTADGFFSRANALLDEAQPLSYGGKYSAHLSEQTAWGLKGRRRVTEEEARQKAEKFLATCGFSGLSLNAPTEAAADSAMPLFIFSLSDQSYVAISQYGGEVISFFSERLAGPESLYGKTALSNANELLKNLGYQNMRLVSRQTVANELLLCYAPYTQGIIYYPDAVSMKFSLDEGNLTALDSHEYWQNHRERDLPAYNADPSEALAILGADASISGTELALISDGAGGETLCHEIRHIVEGEEYLDYICVRQLTEEQVLRGYAARDGGFYTH